VLLAFLSMLLFFNSCSCIFVLLYVPLKSSMCVVCTVFLFICYCIDVSQAECSDQLSRTAAQEQDCNNSLRRFQ
jgi:hypothetical protein